MNRDQILSMSVLSAVLALRNAREKNRSASWHALGLLLTERGMFSLDFNRAIELDLELAWLSCPARDANRTLQFRDVLDHIIRLTNPIWLGATPYGLRSVKDAITDDVFQVLENAGLLGESLDRDAIEWWDRVASGVRKDADYSRVVQGRDAEELSFNFEITQLERQGIKSHVPKWVSIEDNALGYDILSFRISSNGVIREKLIEVKSTSKNYPSFFITRNEWKRAKSSLDQYQFHIWTAGSKSPLELPARDVACHVPEDQGDGAWQNVLIELQKN